MTSEPDSTPRRRPPTIDLTAREVETEAAGSTQKAADAAAAQDRMTETNAPGELRGWHFAARGMAYAVGGVVGAILAAAVIAGLWIVGVLPSHEAIVPPGAAGAKTAAADEISSRLDRIQEALRTPRPEQAFAARMAAAEAQMKSLADSLAALNRRVDEVAAASQGALAQAKGAAAAAEAAKSFPQQPGVERSDLDALANRIAALERAVKALTDDVARHPQSADDRAARLTVAAEALRAAVERGAPYQAELDTVKSLGVAAGALAPLEPFAAAGVPSAAMLARELTALTPALRRASGVAPDESSFFGRLRANAEGMVRIGPADGPASPPRNDPAAIIVRIDVDAAHDDVAAALADIARLPQAARAAAEPWVKKAEAREAAIAASRRIAADALAALGRPAPQ